MAAVLPILILGASESEPSLLHEGGGLEGLTRRLVRHFVRGEFAQFVIDHREQPVSGAGIALMDRVQKLGDLAHAGISVRRNGRATQQQKRERVTAVTDDEEFSTTDFADDADGNQTTAVLAKVEEGTRKG